jgi:hypothetical protein
MKPRINRARSGGPFKVATLVTLASFVFLLALSHRLMAKQSSTSTSAWTDQPHPPISDGPIWIIGLPRSDSLALHGYFTCHGKSSSHCCCGAEEDVDAPTSSWTNFPCPASQQTCGDCVLQNFKSQQPPFQGCGEYDVWRQFDVETQDPYA